MKKKIIATPAPHPGLNKSFYFLSTVSETQRQKISALIPKVLKNFGLAIIADLPANQTLSLYTWSSGMPTAIIPVTRTNQESLGKMMKEPIPLGYLLFINEEEPNQELETDLAHEFGHLGIFAQGRFHVDKENILKCLNYFDKNSQYSLAGSFLNSFFDYFVLVYQYEKNQKEYAQGYLDIILARTIQARQKDHQTRLILYAKAYISAMHFLKTYIPSQADNYKARILTNLALTPQDIVGIDRLLEKYHIPMLLDSRWQDINSLIANIGILVQALRYLQRI